MRQRHRAKVYARNSVYQALKKGTLVKGNCEVCGVPEVEAHHDDYANRLDVRWLCMKHHKEIHGVL